MNYWLIIMNLLLTSKSKLKLSALKKVLGSDTNSIRTIATNTLVEQPIGVEDTISASKYRISRVIDMLEKESKDPELDFIVSLENGVIINDDGLRDFVAACVYSIKLKRTFSYCKLKGHSTVWVPRNNVLGPLMDKVTNDVIFGKLVSQEYPTIQHNNWMKTICKVDRVDQLANAIEGLAKTMRLINDFKCYHDFPRKGIEFRDIIGVLSNKVHKQTVINMMVDAASELFKGEPIDYIVGLDARGFILGGMLTSVIHNAGFVPIRKAGKLPGKCYRVSYEKEYGTDEFELQTDAFFPKKEKLNVLIIDDIIATGGTIKAAIALLKKTGIEINIGLLFLDKVDGLNPDMGDYPKHVLLEQ